jgi:hypothetical protein
VWLQRREELIREIENNQLIRQLKMARGRKARRSGDGLLENVCAYLPWKQRMTEC